MNDSEIKAVFLANGFKEKDQGEGRTDLNPYVYAAARALLASFVPRFKFETLVEHCKRLDGTVARLTSRCHDLELYEEKAVWFWQHDGQDYLESLSCPVVIPAGQLRELLKHDGKYDEKGDPYTYKTTQATRCAGCGQRKHTPLRVDAMGGYVCLTCIDTRLEGFLAEESARDCVKDWDGCQEVADLPAVHEALAAFSSDSTGDAGVQVVKAVIEAVAQPGKAG